MKGSLHLTRLAENRKNPCCIIGFLRVEILVETCSLMIGYFENSSLVEFVTTTANASVKSKRIYKAYQEPCQDVGINFLWVGRTVLLQ